MYCTRAKHILVGEEGGLRNTQFRPMRSQEFQNNLWDNKLSVFLKHIWEINFFFVWHNIHDDFIKTHQNTFTHIYIANQWRNFWCFAAFTKRFREVFDFLLDLELSFDFFRFYCCSYGCWFEMTTVKFLWKNIFFEN